MQENRKEEKKDFRKNSASFFFNRQEKNGEKSDARYVSHNQE